MALGNGTHWSAPLLGSDKAGGGLYEDVPAEALATRRSSYRFVDFIDQADESALTVTNIITGTAAILANSLNGTLQLTATTIDQGLASVQFTNNATEYLLHSANQNIRFCARVTLNDWSDCDWLIGLSPVDTGAMAADGTLGGLTAADMVGFHHLLADGNDVSMTAIANSFTSTTLLSAARIPRSVPANSDVDAVAHEFGMQIVGTDRVFLYLNGILRHSFVTTTPFLATGFVPTFAMIANGNAITMDVDYYWTCQDRI